MKILGIETSCDETAAAVVTDERDILSNIVWSQIEHTPYGGVVPEIASRAHIQNINAVITHALEEANTSLSEVDGIAATAGPGLIGGVIVGLMMAKGMASASGKPFIAVNHLEAHALTARLTNNVPFPFLLLLVSGGHCQIAIVHDIGRYTPLGSTLDDALGEAFDKTAKMLGLGYPGGPVVENRAKQGDPDAFELPQPMVGRPGCDFSFSGLKTALFRNVSEQNDLSDTYINNLCASFQRTCGDILVDRMNNAISTFQEQCSEGQHIVVAGGVAANQYLRARLEALGTSHNLQVIAPPISLCTDNGAMIAWTGIERLQRELTNELNIAPRARWPLDHLDRQSYSTAS